MEKFKEFYKKIRSVQKLNTPEEKEEAMKAWNAGADFARKSKKISSGKVHDIAEKLAKEKRRKNQKLWLKAFCRGYAEANVSEQETKDMTEEIKKLWNANRLMDAAAIARELDIDTAQVLQTVYSFTTASERQDREYAIAKDYYDSTGSWPEGYAPAFEEEADEAAQAETKKEESETEAEKTMEEETERQEAETASSIEEMIAEAEQHMEKAAEILIRLHGAAENLKKQIRAEVIAEIKNKLQI